MQTIDLVQLYTKRLSHAGIKYMVTGSVACVVYGEPRLTYDVDLVIEMSMNQIALLRKAFPESEFYCPPEEILKIDVQRAQRGHFNIIHHSSGFKADFYLAGRDPLQHWGLSKKRLIEVENEKISIAPPEYVILRKLEYFREGGSEKHLKDIQGVLRRQPELKKSSELLQRVETLGLHSQWNRVFKIE